MRLTLDQQLCGTTGQCALIAPKLFRQRDDGIGEVIDASPTDDQLEDAREAELSCPVAAITLS